MLKVKEPGTKDWWQILLPILLLSLSFLFTACEHTSTRPQEFDRLAKTFRDMAGTNRVKEGKRLSQIMPNCPETWRKDIGTGVLVSRDHSQPSYKLTRSEAFSLLGQPDIINGDQVCWELGTNGTTRLELYVQFDGDFVVESDFTASAIDKSNH